MHQVASWFLVLSIMLLFFGLSKKLYTNFIIKGATSSVHQNNSALQSRQQKRQKIAYGNETRMKVDPLHNSINDKMVYSKKSSTRRAYKKSVQAKTYREYSKQKRASR